MSAPFRRPPPSLPRGRLPSADICSSILARGAETHVTGYSLGNIVLMLAPYSREIVSCSAQFIVLVDDRRDEPDPGAPARERLSTEHHRACGRRTPTASAC